MLLFQIKKRVLKTNHSVRSYTALKIVLFLKKRSPKLTGLIEMKENHPFCILLSHALFAQSFVVEKPKTPDDFFGIVVDCLSFKQREGTKCLCILSWLLGSW